MACGALAGPLFVAGFTLIGAGWPAYDWRRHTVSSLALGHRGWQQRANFIVAGGLYYCAASGLGRAPRRSRGRRAVPTMVAAAGLGLIGSGVFVTDPMGDAPPVPNGDHGAHDEGVGATGERPAPTRAGRLHNLCAVPIFAGLPLAALASALVAARRRDYSWASFSAASGLATVASFVLMGRAFGNVPGLAGRGGIFQRISICSALGWLTVLSLRARSWPPPR